MLFFFNCFDSRVTLLVWFVLIAFILLNDLQSGFTYFIFCPPFCMIDMQYGAYCLLASAVVFLVKLCIEKYVVEKNKIPLDTVLVFLALIIFILVPIRTVTLQTFLSAVMMSVLFITFNAVLSFPEVFNVRKNSRVITIALAISVVFSLNFLYADYIYFNRSFFYITSKIIRYAGLLYQPNVLAMFCEFLLMIFLYRIFSKTASKTDYVMSIFLAILGITTFSKTFLILFVVMVIALIIFAFKQNWKITLAVTGGVGFVAVLFVVLKWDFVSLYLNRFIDLDSIMSGDMEAIVNVITTGRYDLWTQYLSAMAERPWTFIWGMGMEKPSPYILSTHNVYIALLYQYGIAGIALLSCVVYRIIRDYIVSNKQKGKDVRFNKALIVPLILVGLLFFVEDIIFYIY